MRLGFLAVLATIGCLGFVAPGAAKGVPEAKLAAHVACAEAGEESGVCAGILTTYCLETASDAVELAICRADVTTALEDRAARLSDTLSERGAAAQAREIAAGANRVVAGFCAALDRHRATSDTPGHLVRCAMMEAHVKVYHLVRALAGMEQKI